MKKIILPLLVTGLVLMGISSLGMAHGMYGMHGGPGYGAQRPGYMTDQYDPNPLGLNEEQQEELYKIQQDSFAKQVELSRELRDREYQLRKMSFSDTDKAEIDKLNDEIYSLLGQLQSLHEKKWTTIKGILTSEQIEKFGQLYNDKDNDGDYDYGYGMMGGMFGSGYGMMGGMFGSGYGMMGGMFGSGYGMMDGMFGSGYGMMGGMMYGYGQGRGFGNSRRGFAGPGRPWHY